MKLTILFRILVVGVILSSQTAIAQTSANLLAGSPSDPNLKVMKAWYSAWEKKDWNSMRQTLADGFTFSSPVDDHISIARFKERTWPNADNIKRFVVDQLVMNGNNALVITNGYTLSGKLFRNCDSFKFKDGKIIAYECFFGPGLHAPDNETK